MARLPTVGGDNNNWGQILNEYLSVEHNPDGSLKLRTDGSFTPTLADGSVTASKLSSTVNNYLADAQTAVQSVNGKVGQAVTLTASDVSAVATTTVGAASGIATLDGTSKLTASQLPANVATKSASSSDAGKAIDAYSGTPFDVVTAAEIGLQTSDRIRDMGRRAIPLTIAGGVNLTNNSTTVTCTSTNGLEAGMELLATGITQGTKIASITNSTTFVLDANATATTVSPASCRAWRLKQTDVPTLTSNTSSQISGSVIQNTAATLSSKYRLSAKYVNSQSSSYKWFAGATWTGSCTLTSGSPTVTVNSTGGLSPGVPISGTGVPAGAKILTVNSATTLTLDQNATQSTTSTLSAQTTETSGGVRLEFDFNGDEFELRMANSYLRVWVDEEMLWARPRSYTPGLFTYYKFAFGNVKNRRICIEFDYNNSYPQFYGIYCHPRYQVLPPSIPSTCLIGVTDSFGQGVGADYNLESYFIQMARLMGFAHIIVGQTTHGGTGLVTDNTSSNFARYISRINDTKEMIQLAYDQGRQPALVIQCTLNDAGVGKAGTVGPALIAYIENMRTSYPPLPIYVMGPPYPKTPSSDLLTLNTECKAAAATAGVPYADTLQAFSNPTSYFFNGTGTFAAPTGDGNADIFCAADGSHPSPDGHRYGLPLAYAPILAKAMGIEY